MKEKQHGKLVRPTVAVPVLLSATIGLLGMNYWLFDGCPDTQRANTLPEPYKTVVLTLHRHLGT